MSANELIVTLMPRSINYGGACLAYFNKIRGIPIYLSQFIHGGHLASGTYRKNLGTEKIIGEFVTPANWYIAFRVCWLSLSQPGNIILSRVSNSGMQYLNPEQEAAVVAAIEATKSTDPRELH